MEKAAAVALRNGVNLDCGSEFQSLKGAYDQKLITKAHIDSALFPLLKLKFELGILDAPGTNKYDDLGEKEIASTQNHQLALRAAEKSCVLLENNATLPLSSKTKSIAVVGPLAFEPRVLLANYHGWSGQLSTVLEGITQAAPANCNLSYEQGFELYNANTTSPIAVPNFSGYENVVIALGMNTLMQGEDGDAKYSKANGDLVSLNLPENQLTYLKNLRKNYKGKIIVLLFSGSPLITSEIKSNSDALLWCGYPGEAGGEAIANILFGKTSPSGKLPFTFPKLEKDLPAFDDYSMKNRTYAFTEHTPEYSFGFGKNYLACSIVDIQNYPLDNGRFNVTIKNNSSRSGQDILQVYLHPLTPKKDEANYRLVHFSAIQVSANSQSVFPVLEDATTWCTYDAEGKKQELIGEYELIFSLNGPNDISAIRKKINFSGRD